MPPKYTHITYILLHMFSYRDQNFTFYLFKYFNVYVHIEFSTSFVLTSSFFLVEFLFSLCQQNLISPAGLLIKMYLT